MKATFIDQDIKILSEFCEVEVCINNWKGISNAVKSSLGLALKIFRNRNKIDIIFISFAGYWSMIAAILGKIYKIKVFIVLNGTESVYIPHLNYGSLGSPLMKKACYISFKYATLLLPVSKSLIFFEDTYSTDKSFKYGLDFHFPKNNFKYKVVHNGIDTKFWIKEDTVQRNLNKFITVLTSDTQGERKGLPLIIELAKLSPSDEFYIGGAIGEGLTNLPSNIFFLGRLTPQELRTHYSKCTFYLQLSNYEGFGVALCEAMLCNCVPIVSNVNMLPEIAGKAGFVLKKANPLELSHLVKEAQESENLASFGMIARDNIESYFSLEQRKKNIKEILDNF